MKSLKDENGKLLPDNERLTEFGRFLRSTSLDEIPELIHQLEKKIAELESIISAESFYQQSYEQNQQTLEHLSNTQKNLDQAMERWVEIENQAE